MSLRAPRACHVENVGFLTEARHFNLYHTETGTVDYVPVSVTDCEPRIEAMPPPRPATGSQRKAPAASLAASQQPLQGKLRPQSAALLTAAPSAAAPESPPRTASGPAAAANGERVGATSDELIRDLEHKVRKVVELKRATSDKLRFAVAKKREEVEKAKLILQDLIKDSEALGLHYTGGGTGNQVEDAARGAQAAKAADAHDDKIVEEPNRLQPIASISRRPVYPSTPRSTSWRPSWRSARRPRTRSCAVPWYSSTSRSGC